jgi:peptide/nickel transport system ATP-binding protein
MANSTNHKNITQVALNLAANLISHNPEGKKLLLSIRNLKQYFPVKGRRGVFVKACDGISLDIYEGETLGLVGESGCGKSTFGRTLLQLYVQTFGRTLFYGRTIDSIAPKYFKDSVKKLPALKSNLLKLYEKAKETSEEFDALKASSAATEKQVFTKMAERDAHNKAAEDAFFDLVEIFGGLLLYEKEDEVIAAYEERYYAALSRNKIVDEIDKIELAHREAAGVTRNVGGVSVEVSRDGDDLAKKRASLEQKIKEKQKTLDAAEKVLKQKHDAIDAIRHSITNVEGFAQLESLRDEGIDLARLKYNEMRLLRRDMQLIFQDPYSSLNPRMSVGQIVGEGPLSHGFFSGTGEALQNHVTSVLEDCGLAPYMIHRYPHQFSGGQRQRIGIARSLSLKPKFIVCDEAVSALDVSIQSQVLNLLTDLKEKNNLTYLFISHDLSVIKYVSDRIGVMYLGNVVELAESEALFKRPLHPYTEALLSAIPTTNLDQTRNQILLEGDIPSPVKPPPGCKFHTRCRYVTDICKEVIPELKENGKGHFVACHHCLN